MSAVSNSVMPRSIALWITLREVSRSVRWPKLLQPRPTAETRRPEPPRLRICMDRSCEVKRETISHCDASISKPQGSIVPRASTRLEPLAYAAGNGRLTLGSTGTCRPTDTYAFVRYGRPAKAVGGLPVRKTRLVAPTTGHR